MPTTTATVTTIRASSYLQQLCKHFGHKVPVDFTPQTGEITLPFGICSLRAGDDALTLFVNAEAENLQKMQKVIGDHLARFAFRENPEVFWRPADAAAPLPSDET